MYPSLVVALFHASLTHVASWQLSDRRPSTGAVHGLPCDRTQGQGPAETAQASPRPRPGLQRDPRAEVTLPPGR